MVNRAWKLNQEEYEGSADEQELALVVDDLVERLLSGDDLNLSAFLREHHRFGRELRQIFPVLQLLSECSWRRGHSDAD